MSAATVEKPATTSAMHFLHGAAPLIRMLSNALIAAGTDDTLPMLYGVKLEHDGEALTIVATDRYRLLFESSDLGLPTDHAPVAPFDVFLPRAAAKFALSWLTSQRRSPVKVLVDSAANTIRFQGAETSIEVRTSDVTFPKWRDLVKPIKNAEPVSSIGFTPKFLADIGKVRSEWRHNHITVSLAGPLKPVRVEFQDGPTLILMPTRTESAA